MMDGRKSSFSFAPAVDNTPVITATQDPASAHSENTDGNDKYSLFWLFGVVFLYFIWGWLQGRKLQGEIKPANIGANLHNIVVVTLSAVIGINLMNVFFTKISSMNIPLLSKFSGRMVPLFRL